MVSAIDPTKPEDGVPAVKSDLRANLQAAHDEIEVLQGAGAPVLTSIALAKDALDQTKLVGIDASAVAANTRRNIIMPDADVDLGNLGGGASLPADDTTALVRDPVDNTKLARLDVGAVATGTTRTITMPDRDVNLGATQPVVPVTEFGAAGDGSDDTAAFLASIAALGYAYVPPEGFFGIQDLLLPDYAHLFGSSRMHSVIVGLNAATPVIKTRGNYVGFNEISDLCITGVGTRAIELIQSPVTHVRNIQIGSPVGSPGNVRAVTFGTFDIGMYTEEFFSSSVTNVSTIGPQISDVCFWFACANHSTTYSGLQTSNFCNANFRFSNNRDLGSSTGFSSAGMSANGLAAQGGNIGFDIQDCAASSFNGLYTENTGLPMRVSAGTNYATDTVFSSTFTGLILLGPAVSHPDYANRTCALFLNSVDNCTFEGINMGSWGTVDPKIDGIWYSLPRNVTINNLRAPNLGVNTKHFLLKRLSDASSLSAITMGSTDNVGRTIYLENGGGAHQMWERTYDSSGNVVTTSYVPTFAASPPVGLNQTQYAGSTIYEVDDFVYINAAPANGDPIYRCVTAGTSGAGTPPTGTGTAIADGSVVWDFHGTIV